MSTQAPHKSPSPSGTRPGAPEIEAPKSPHSSSMAMAELHGQLHELTSRRLDEPTARGQFREITMRFTGAVGVAHLLRDPTGQWNLAAEYGTGRIPKREDLVAQIARCAETALQRNQVQVESFLGIEAIYAPMRAVGGTGGEVLLVLTNPTQSTQAIFALEVITAYFSFWIRDQHAQSNDWKLTSLAAMIELVTDVGRKATVSEGCQTIANELVRYLGCRQVAVGFIKKGHIIVEAVSGSNRLDHASRAYRAWEAALSEALLRDRPGVWPPQNPHDVHVYLAHRQLASEMQVPAVMTVPLKTVDNQVIGAMALTGSVELLHGDRFANFASAVAPRIAGELQLVQRAQPNVWKRAERRIRPYLGTSRIWLWLVALASIAGLLAVHVPYRVRCHCTTEPTQRRYAVAPFEGLVREAFVEPGDIVTKGQRLAEMDGQSIQWELAGVTAERRQAHKQRQIDLAQRDVPATVLSQLKAKRLTSQEKMLEIRQSQVQITSPIDGVVLSGSLQQAEAASVPMGKILFEVGPLEQMKIQLTIPADEVARVQPGQPVRVWFDGLTERSLVGTLERIHPRSELREARNVFIGQVLVDNTELLLRPGMQGHARIDCAKSPLAWNLFHRSWESLTARLVWW